MSNFWLSDEQFDKISPLLPNKPRGVPRVDDRRVLSGIIFCIQRGYRCSGVPPAYDPAKTLYKRWKRCSEAGVLEPIFETLARDTADLSRLMIDASQLKTHRIAANGVKKNTDDGRSIGKTKGGLNSKLHLVCDGGAPPVHLHLTAGKRADISQTRQCLEPYVSKKCTVIADRGYDANHLRDWLAQTKATACIPPLKTAKCSMNMTLNFTKHATSSSECSTASKIGASSACVHCDVTALS